MSMLCMTPIVVPIFLVAIQGKILNPPPMFRKIWGSLFTEFKHDKGLLSSMYYPLFFFRRAIYVVNMMTLADYVWVTLAINLGCSLINLAFISYYNPYISRLTNFVAMCTEFGIGCMFGLCVSFEYGYDAGTSENVIWTGVSLILLIMGINLVELFYGQLLWFKRLM